MDNFIQAEGFTLKASKSIIADRSKATWVNVVDTAECFQKCEEPADCVALSVTTTWAQNRCAMFSEVTSSKDDASYSSKVLGCAAGLDFQVPCYLLQQEFKLTDTMSNLKMIKEF